MSKSYPPPIKHDGNKSDINWEEISRWVTDNPEEEYDVEDEDVCPMSYSSSFAPSQNSSFAPSQNSSFPPSHNSSFAPSRSSSFAPSHGSSFAPSYNSSFAPSHSTSFAPSYNSSFAPSRSSSFPPSHSSSFAPSHSSSFAPSRSSSFAPSHSSSFAPPHSSSFAPSHSTSIGEASASASIGNIDWEKLAESFMQRQVDEMNSDAVDSSFLGSSINEEREAISPAELQWVHDNWEEMYEEKMRNLPSMYWDASRREKKYNPEQYRRRKNPDEFVYQGNDNSSLIRTSFFEHDDSSIHPLEKQTMALSGMEGSFLHDSTQKSDILDYLEDKYERVRPESVAEGYHFAGREYGPPAVYMWPEEHRAYTSTPIKRRSSMAETFEMVDGSKMINITLEEMAEFSKRIHHVTDVRDTKGREIVHIERDYETDPNGNIHRVEKARRWLDTECDAITEE